jgi:hypothetical protein
MTVFDYIALGSMGIVLVASVWLLIYVGDLPANIAKERNHPQVAAIRAMSWFGLLLTGGVLWVVAVVWAYYGRAAVLVSEEESGGEP